MPQYRSELDQAGPVHRKVAGGGVSKVVGSKVLEVGGLYRIGPRLINPIPEGLLLVRLDF